MEQDFFKLGDIVTDRIVSSLRQKLNLVGIVVGGGYGYDSIKYKDTGKLGDLDYLAVLENINDFTKFAQNKDLIEECGFEISETNIYYEKDLKLFESKDVSILRFSGINNGLKTTLNFTTIERLQSMYTKASQEKAYKIAHGKSQNILVAKGTDGTDLVLALIAPEVSGWFGDGVKHFLVPDHTWYEENSYLHAGILTDFIAKGKVIEIKGRMLNDVQSSILKYMKQRSSMQIRKNKEWHLMFASNNYFSQEFKNFINKKIDDIEAEFNEASECISQQKHLGIVFPEIEYYKSELLSRDSTDFKFPDKSGIKFQNLINSNLSYDEILHIINAEAKRLSTLLSLSKGNTEFKLPKYVTYDHLIFLPKDELISDTEEKSLYAIYKYIMENSVNDYNQISNSSNFNEELLNFLTQLRLAIADRILNSSEEKLIYGDKYKVQQAL